MHMHVDDLEPARIDPVEAEHRKYRRKRSRRVARHLLEHLDHVERVGQSPVALAAPIVEISGDDQRRGTRNRLHNPVHQRANLPLPSALEKSEMYIDAMQCRNALAERDLAMQEATAFKQVRRYVKILLRQNRKP